MNERSSPFISAYQIKMCSTTWKPHSFMVVRDGAMLHTLCVVWMSCHGMSCKFHLETIQARESKMFHRDRLLTCDKIQFHFESLDAFQTFQATQRATLNFLSHNSNCESSTWSWERSCLSCRAADWFDKQQSFPWLLARALFLVSWNSVGRRGFVLTH